MFRSAEAALSWVDNGGVPDVVIADHRLPGIKGVDFLTSLADRFPQATRVLYTADLEVTADQPEHPFVVLRKPVPPSHLKQLVARALSRAHQMPPPW